MHIEASTKLDFGDVLLRPKRSTMNSRREVKLERKFKEFSRRATFVRVNNQLNTSLAQYDTDNR